MKIFEKNPKFCDFWKKSQKLWFFAKNPQKSQKSQKTPKKNTFKKVSKKPQKITQKTPIFRVFGGGRA